MSLRGRLLAASLILVALGLAVVGAATYIAFRGFLLQQVDNQLTATVRTYLEAASTPVRTNIIPVGQVSFELLNADGSFARAPVRTDGALPVLPSSLSVASSLSSASPITVPASQAHQHFRILAVEVDSNTNLVMGIPLTSVVNDLRRLVAVEVLVGGAVLLAAAMLGSWLVKIGLRPLQEIETTAEKIAEGNLTDRVPVADEATEVGRLARTFNAMLARIEAAFEERRRSEDALRASEERLRRFVSDASHELRTPIASVRANAELFRRGGENHPEDLPRLMGRIESEAARMGLLVEDLLLLTRLDQGRPLERAPVDLGALADEAVDAARIIEPERTVTLSVRGSVEVLGDKDRLRQIFDNLLTNVRRHTPPGTQAWVTVEQQDDRAILEVADAGPGIDPTDGVHIFERFYRADSSRSRDRGGSGLGLSIVAAITAAHGGVAAATNRVEGGAVFRVELPALVEPPRPEPIAEDIGDLDEDVAPEPPPAGTPAEAAVLRQ